MPKYTNPMLLSWNKKGYMDFMLYPKFKELYQTIPKQEDRALLTFYYFTGSRAEEALYVKRSDCFKQGDKIKMMIPVLKRRKDQKVRLAYLPLNIPEIAELWQFIQPQPADFFIFGWLRSHSNIRAYTRNKFKIPTMFFRHNLWALMRIAGASRQQIKEGKGALSDAGVIAYDHLSEAEHKEIGNLIVKGLTIKEAVLKGDSTPPANSPSE